MAYCQHCGTNLDTNPNFCPNCGAALNGDTTQQANGQQQTYNQQNNRQWSNTAKTVGTVAGVAVGASVLGGLLRRRRRRPPMPPHGGFMGGPGMHRHGPMRGSGGRGPMGGPGGHR